MYVLLPTRKRREEGAHSVRTKSDALPSDKVSSGKQFRLLVIQNKELIYSSYQCSRSLENTGERGRGQLGCPGFRGKREEIEYRFPSCRVTAKEERFKSKTIRLS